MLRRCARRHASTYLSKRLAKAEEISTFPEIVQRDIFLNDLNHGEPSMRPHATSSTTAPLQMSKQDLNTCLDAGLLTFALHIESRISSALGEGFYTIGPCGEEPLAGVALALRPDDSVAGKVWNTFCQLARYV